MIGRSFVATVALCAGLLLGSPAIAAGQYSDLVVFGDSLVDTGNARLGSLGLNLPDPAPPALGYVAGRFTNGANFADYLSEAISGKPSTAYLQGGQNYAVGGALTAFTNGETSPSFLPQLGIFAATKQPIASDALVLVTFGGNDIRSVVTDTGVVDFTPTITALTTGLSALVADGARNIVVTGLPDIGDLPSTQSVAAAQNDPSIITTASLRSATLDAAFKTATGTVAQASGANVQFFDLLSYERALTADPQAFGLPAGLSHSSCLIAGASAVAAGCNGYLYFDTIHPTTEVHGAIATAIEQQLGIAGAVPEPGTWLLTVLGVGSLGAVLRRGRAKAERATA